MDSFKNKKALRFVITLSTGTFGSSKGNQIILQGYRASADIDLAGWLQMGTLKARIFGVSQSDMNYATFVQWQLRDFNPNTIAVYAIDGTQETLVFIGNIVNAWGNYQSQPNAFLEIQATMAYGAALRPIAPKSFRGSIDVASAMAQIVSAIPDPNGSYFMFENNGVNVQLTDVYLAGTAKDMILKLAQSANIDVYMDGNVIGITPAGCPRNGQIPLISSSTGLVGYPTFDGYGVNFTTVFNPAIRHKGLVNLQSSIPMATGQWIVTSVAHQLDSETPNGRWHSAVRGNKNGLAFIA